MRNGGPAEPSKLHQKLQRDSADAPEHQQPRSFPRRRIPVRNKKKAKARSSRKESGKQHFPTRLSLRAQSCRREIQYPTSIRPGPTMLSVAQTPFRALTLRSVSVRAISWHRLSISAIFPFVRGGEPAKILIKLCRKRSATGRPYLSTAGRQTEIRRH